VSNAAHRDDVARRGGIVAKLSAQMADVHIDEMLVTHPRLRPHGIEKLPATQYDAWPSRQRG
jgi:hypothetical protein